MGFSDLQKISESATTCVYRAHDDGLKRDVLLKVLHRHLAHDEELRRRFVREARACAAIRSDNVVQVYDLREHEGAPALVMEYVEGRSLKDVIAEGGERTQVFAETVAVHVLRGLAAANARGIIHRDIKPGNILVSPAGTVKITDFGLAQIEAGPTLTAEGTVVGTPAYLAPEILRGEAADVRTDLFSLGATLAEILTGRRLFEGASYSDCVTRILRFTPDALDALAGTVTPDFVVFLKRLMDPDPGRRYGSAGEALAALGRAGTPPGPGRSMLWRGAAALLLVLAAGLYFGVRNFTGSADMAGPEGASPSAREERSLRVPPEGAGRRAADTAAVNAPAETGGPSIREGSPTAVQRPASRPPSLLSGQRRAQAPVTTRPAADSAQLALGSAAGVSVLIDSLYAGELPLARPLKVAAGTHTVLFTHPLLGPLVKIVHAGPGETVAVNANFLERAGFLRCTSSPWAEISVDDRYRDTTPFDAPMLVAAGKHRVRFHHPAFADSIREVTVAAQETVFVSVNFRR